MWLHFFIFIYMARKKILLKPKSELGLDHGMIICYNCIFWNRKTGWCPWYEEYNDYNHMCLSLKQFRYSFERMDEGYKNLHI